MLDSSSYVSFYMFCKERANELRIDAAEREKDRGKEHCAAASVRVGLGRTPNPATRDLGIQASQVAQKINRGNRWLVQQNNCT